jgi:Flp pilus assembly pilin Flp
VRDAAFRPGGPITPRDREGGAAPLFKRHQEESRRGAEHRPNRANDHLPDYSKGGEIVLKLFASMHRRGEGQTMAEYGVVLAVVTLAVVASLTLLSDNMRAAFESIAGILPG